MLGYWNKSDETAAACSDDDGWFRTGDAGWLSEDGYLFLHDRIKDMIVSGGENVYPAEVENALLAHAMVADAAVIGVPDDRWGETVKAVVVIVPGAVRRRRGAGRRHLAATRERLAHYKCPTSIDFVDVLPRNPSGKVLKRELRAPTGRTGSATSAEALAQNRASDSASSTSVVAVIRPISLADGLEPRDQLLHSHAGALQPTVELVHDLGGPLELVDQTVDVDHAGLELGDDAVELGSGVRIAEFTDRNRPVDHFPCVWPSVASLRCVRRVRSTWCSVTVEPTDPSASWVASADPGASPSTERSTAPEAARVTE